VNKTAAIEMLRQELDKIPHLMTLPYYDGEFKLWRDRVLKMIDEGLEEADYWKFFQLMSGPCCACPMPDSVYQEDYLENLNQHEKVLKGMINKYEI